MSPWGFNCQFPTDRVKPVLSGHSKKDKTKVLMANGSLRNVKSIAECCNTFDIHKAIIVWKTNFWSFFEWPLQTGFTVPIQEAIKLRSAIQGHLALLF